MGAATCINSAGKTNKGDFLIASVPYASFKRLFQNQLKMQYLPPFLLPFLRLAGIFELGLFYDQNAPENFIKKIKMPIFLISAVKDEMVNTHDASYLFTLANQPKLFWRADARHNIFADHPIEYQRHILKFLHFVISGTFPLQ